MDVLCLAARSLPENFGASLQHHQNKQLEPFPSDRSSRNTGVRVNPCLVDRDHHQIPYPGGLQ
jgi:hypothetical protein